MEPTNSTVYPVNVNWVGNGINLSIGGDMPRRVYVSRLVTNSPRPYQKNDFTIKNLDQYVAEHRYEFIKDILTIAKAYHNAGKPEPKWTDDITGKTYEIPTMGGFEEWRNYIGGMMVFAGKRNFLANMNEIMANFESQNDEDEVLLERLHLSFQDREFSAKQITDDKDKRFDDFLPSYIVNSTGRKSRMLNTHLSHIRDRVFPSGIKVVFSNVRSKTQMWVIKSVIPPSGQANLITDDYAYVPGAACFTNARKEQVDSIE